MTSVRVSMLVWPVILLLLPLHRGEAQTNAETSSAWIQLNLSVPGARSLGLGGAFLALADDATSAYANPAGLAFLPGVQATAEFRGWQFEHKAASRGRIDGPLRGGFDDRLGVERDTESDSTEGASFLSFLYGGQGWGFAAYGHRLADFEANFETDGVFLGENRRLFPSKIEHDVEITNLGLSFGKAIRKLNLALGIGVAFYDFEIDSRSQRFSIGLLEGPPPQFVDANRHDQQLLTGKGGDEAVLAGFLWAPSPEWRLGGSFRGGGTFPFQARSEPGKAFFGQDRKPFEPPREPTFRVPQVVGVGMLYAPLRRTGWGLTASPKFWKLAIDAYYIDYSVFGERVVDVFNLPGVGIEHREQDFRSEDGIEVHVGSEMLFRRGRRFPFYLRVGAWYDPDHAVEYVGTDERLRAFREVFTAGKDIWHGSFGFGTTAYKYQIDLAADFSERVSTYSLSAVYRFSGKPE